MQPLKGGFLLQGGKYRIECALGMGGFGITYLATQALLERKVAIKEFFFRDFCVREGDTPYVSLSTQSKWEIAQRFLNKFINEARTISRLRHPAIIPIYDVFCENGTAYFVMEYIEGDSMEDLLKSRGPLPQAEALSYIRSVGEALSYIHQRSINHLDVKPSNIMLRRADNQIILIDFGVAKQYDELTKEGTATMPVGISDGYSPPEQYCRNGVQMFSPEADVYALAATLFTLLTGQIPPEATVLPDVGLPVDELRQRGVSEHVISAIAQAMKPRSSRTQSMKEFLASLGGISAEGLTIPLPNLFPPEKPNSTPLHKSFWPYLAVVAMGFFFSMFIWLVWEKPLPWQKERQQTVTIVTEVNRRALRIPLGECTYTGEVDSSGNPHGQGEALFSDGRSYKGSFVHGVAEGNNVFFRNEKGDTYEGSFKNNRFEGKGRYTYTDGSYFIGTFENGNPINGCMYSKTGKLLDEIE